MDASHRLRIGLAALVLGSGLIHLQQFLAGFSAIPIIGPSFLANAAISVAVAALVIWKNSLMSVLAAVALSAGSLAAFLISRGPGLFGYVSTTFGIPEASAVTFELGAVALATVMLIQGQWRPRLI